MSVTRRENMLRCPDSLSFWEILKRPPSTNCSPLAEYQVNVATVVPVSISDMIVAEQTKDSWPPSSIFPDDASSTVTVGGGATKICYDTYR